MISPPEKNARFEGVYVHVPFCGTKCPYCGFFSVAQRGSSAAYFDALEREAERRAGGSGGGDPSPGEGRPADGGSQSAGSSRGAATLYVGGGTPSLDRLDRVAGLPGLARRLFGLRDGAEVSIEVNPDDVTRAKLEALRGAGFNRVSIGVQSLDDAELRFLGRRHDAGTAVRAVSAARDAGFGSVGIDLIFGLAGQTADRWRRTLRAAVSLSPDHISCYQLTVERGTPFAAREAAGDPPAADEEAQRALFLEADRILTGEGFEHYEVSNYARGRAHRSRHNGIYWRHAPYLGLGPSAHSFDGRRRWWNDPSVGEYIAALDAGVDPPGGMEILTDGQLLLERLMLGLRTSDGVPLDLVDGFSRGREVLDELAGAGLMTIAGGRAAPTAEGFLVADRLPLLLIY